MKADFCRPVHAVSAKLMRLIGSPEERRTIHSVFVMIAHLTSEHPSVRPRFDVHCSFSKPQGVEEKPS